ncbi:Ras GTPase-activating protein 1 [Geodia barretti]|uniref:Ras GTPase-activating protein 1 n=1 Tax=Geodia barretti TaxID=519541 RepID=A0AA35SQP2_GEOBA|nr:Ras GTPase-activating protein 1 [Geodia barretti]
MDDVVDRYRSEVIIDGITLGAPIIQTVRPVGRQAMTVTSPRDRTNSIILTQAHRQGEKTGLLLLRKGKKSPVYGKWKEFYFVIKYGEQKLLYYEREDSHKAKGLLDLRQCQTFAVDPTLYGRYACYIFLASRKASCALTARYAARISLANPKLGRSRSTMFNICTSTKYIGCSGCG